MDALAGGLGLRLAGGESGGGKAEGRYRMFRTVGYQLRASRAVMAANLTKGLE